MKKETCKSCPYYKAYYHGYGVNMVYLSYRCTWALKKPENVKPEECRKAIKEEEWIIMQNKLSAFLSAFAAGMIKAFSAQFTI